MKIIDRIEPLKIRYRRGLEVSLGTGERPEESWVPVAAIAPGRVS